MFLLSSITPLVRPYSFRRRSRHLLEARALPTCSFHPSISEPPAIQPSFPVPLSHLRLLSLFLPLFEPTGECSHAFSKSLLSPVAQRRSPHGTPWRVCVEWICRMLDPSHQPLHTISHCHISLWTISNNCKRRNKTACGALGLAIVSRIITLDRAEPVTLQAALRCNTNRAWGPACVLDSRAVRATRAQLEQLYIAYEIIVSDLTIKIVPCYFPPLPYLKAISSYPRGPLG